MGSGNEVAFEEIVEMFDYQSMYIEQVETTLPLPEWFRGPEWFRDLVGREGSQEKVNWKGDGF